MKRLIYALFLLSSLQSMAQSAGLLKKDQIIITGTIVDSMLATINKAPYVTFYNNYNQEDPSSREIIPLNIKNRQFTVTIMPHGQFGYFDIGGGMVRSITNDEFLIERGDSISMVIKNLDEVAFSGKGAEKLSFQNWAGKFIGADVKIWGVQDKMLDIMEYNKKRSVRFMAVAMDVLNKDTVIKKQVKDVLRLNTASSISKQYLNSITLPSYFPDSSYYQKLKAEINFLITQQNGFVVSDSTLLQNSFMYVQYLFELNKAIAMIKTKSDRAPANIVYINIKSEYTGLLRDKILPYCFLTMLKRNPDVIAHLLEALTLVKDSTSQKILRRVEIASSPGVKAFDFKLETLAGKKIKLNDFKGKVIILETYYNGCMPCRDLAIHMEPITEHFKDRKDVVFINMDGVAKDFKAFEKGARSGKYGSKKSIYAWTNGLGQAHPLLLHYQYNSFPNMLIIDKDGNVVSSNPEKPLNDESKNKFISLINQHL